MLQIIVIAGFLALAAGFAYYLVRQDQGEREPVGALWAAFGFGALGVILAGAAEYFVVPDPTSASNTAMGLAAASLAIGVVEELAKCSLVAFYLYPKRFFNEHTDGVIYFALAGLGFGLPENILYTLQEGGTAGMARIIMTPLFHAATTALVGYALIKFKLDHAGKGFVIGMLGLAIGLHAIYDFGLFLANPLWLLLSIMVTAGLTAGVFLLFLHARGLDQLAGLSRVGNNRFCRSCGTPNPAHNLYCSHCGKRA